MKARLIINKLISLCLLVSGCAPDTGTPIIIDGHSINTTYANSGIFKKDLAKILKKELGTKNYSGFTLIAVPGQTAQKMLARTVSHIPDRTGLDFGIVTVYGALNNLDEIAKIRATGDTILADKLLENLIHTYQEYAQHVTSKNWTIIYFEEAAAYATSYTPEQNMFYIEEIKAWNNFLRSEFNNPATFKGSGLVPTMADKRFGNHKATLNTSIYVDRTHLTNEGRRALAQMAVPVIESVRKGVKPRLNISISN